MRIVKVKRKGNADILISYVDISKIVSISIKNNGYYLIYFDNAVWSVYGDSYEDVMRAWLNPEKDCVPQELVDLIRRKQN